MSFDKSLYDSSDLSLTTYLVSTFFKPFSVEATWKLKLELLDEWIDYSIVQDLFGPIEKSFIKLTDDYDKGDISYEELFKTLYYNYLFKS